MKNITGKRSNEIIEKYIPCTCGEMFLSRKLNAPDCPLHAFDWESAMEEITSLLELENSHLKLVINAAEQKIAELKSISKLEPDNI